MMHTYRGDDRLRASVTTISHTIHFLVFGRSIYFAHSEMKTDTMSNIKCKCYKISQSKIMHFFDLPFYYYVWCARESSILCVLKVSVLYCRV